MSHQISIHQAQSQILRELLFAPHATFTALRKQTGLQSDHFKFHIQKLVELGFVDKSADGHYSLTPSGKEHANRLDTDTNTVERQPKAAVMLLIEHPEGGDKYLFQQRKKHPYFDFWGMPTGKIRWGETIHQAAVRELAEETGLTGDTEFIGIYHELTRGDSGQLLEDKIFFMMRCSNTTGQLMTEFEGGINRFMTQQQTADLDKKYNTFDFELEFALGQHQQTLVEQEQSYTADQF